MPSPVWAAELQLIVREAKLGDEVAESTHSRGDAGKVSDDGRVVAFRPARRVLMQPADSGEGCAYAGNSAEDGMDFRDAAELRLFQEPLHSGDACLQYGKTTDRRRAMRCTTAFDTASPLPGTACCETWSTALRLRGGKDVRNGREDGLQRTTVLLQLYLESLNAHFSSSASQFRGRDDEQQHRGISDVGEQLRAQTEVVRFDGALRGVPTD